MSRLLSQYRKTLGIQGALMFENLCCIVYKKFYIEYNTIQFIIIFSTYISLIIFIKIVKIKFSFFGDHFINITINMYIRFYF